MVVVVVVIIAELLLVVVVLNGVIIMLRCDMHNANWIIIADDNYCCDGHSDDDNVCKMEMKNMNKWILKL